MQPQLGREQMIQQLQLFVVDDLVLDSFGASLLGDRQEESNAWFALVPVMNNVYDLLTLLAMDWLLNYERFNRKENLHPKKHDQVFSFFGPVSLKNSTFKFKFKN